jgi:threonyl-tRNA synthetase
MIHITLPDGSRKPFDEYPTGLDVAKSISEGLARDCVAMEIDGRLVDLSRPLKAMLPSG